jgi:hypothetical protein
VTLEFARTLLDGRSKPTGEDIRRAEEAGCSDGEAAEIIAIDVLTNDFTIAVETPFDFPTVRPLGTYSARRPMLILTSPDQLERRDP